MGLLTDEATRLTARVAPYRSAIGVARKAGLTWRDLARLFGSGVKPNRLRWAYLHCGRYEAEQVPLPEPKKEAPKTVQTAMNAARGGFKDITPKD